MKSYFLLFAIFGMAVPALSLNCYYGSTDDGDDDPEDDWDSSCTGNTYVDCTVSCGDNDGTKVPACFKVRFEGDDDFISVYGCVDDWQSPTSGGSEVPTGYSIDNLGLDTDLPDPDDDECEEDDNYNLTDDWTEDFGGGDINSWHCACDGNECNGSSRNAATAAALVSVLAAMAF